MNNKHFFVPLLDVGEFLPFGIRNKQKLIDQIKEHERAKKEMEKFIRVLEEHFKEPIWYIGVDVIGEKYYERFIFDNGGFLELIMEAPCAINAHFVHEDRAGKFVKALQNSLKKTLPSSGIVDMFIDSLMVKTSEDQMLTVHKWHTIKNLKE